MSRHLAVGAVRYTGIGQCIVVLCGFETCRYPVHEGQKGNEIIEAFDYGGTAKLVKNKVNQLESTWKK
jgi:hypothetical protein